MVHIDEGFDFLSVTIRRMRKRGTSKHYVYTMPSKKAIQAVKDKVSAKTYRSTRNPEPEVLIQSINRTLGGWANYHRHGVSKAVFSAVDHHAWNRIMRWLRHKYKHGRSGLGMPELGAASAYPGTWRFAVNGVRFTGASAVPVTRYRYRGSNIPTPWAPQPVRQHPAEPSGQGTWSARCGESRTPGAAGGPGKPTRSNPGRAPRSDPTGHQQSLPAVTLASRTRCCHIGTRACPRSRRPDCR